MGGLRGFCGFIRSLCEDDSGQATVEYILLLTFTITGTAALARVILSAIDRGILRFGAQLEMDLKTGRTSLGGWSN